MDSPKGCLHLRALPNTEIIKSSSKKENGCVSKFNRNQHIPSTNGERRRVEKGAEWRGLPREQVRINI